MAKKKTLQVIDADIIGPAEPPTHTYSEKDAEEHLKDPNIIFIGRRVRNGITERSEPPAYVIDGRDRFDLPHAALQTAGFYHKEASRIIRAFPQLYKAFIKLGDK
jgi:hypothetical protein